MRPMTTLLFSIPFAISILLSSHVAFGNVSGSADVQVDLSFLNLQNLPLTIISITSTSTADGDTATVSGSGATSVVATPEFLSLSAMTTNSILHAHSSFDFPLSTVGVNTG